MIGYLRVSTEEQATSGLGLEAQREAIQRYADQQGWTVVWYEDAGLSAKSLARPALQEALARLHPKKRDVDGLLVAKLDRLSRSVVDFAGVLELARARKWALVAIDLGVDTSTPTGELVANVMMSVAQWERRVIGERTSAAMQAAKRQGKRISRDPVLPAATADKVLELRSEGLSFARIATRLNEEGVPAALGGVWHTSTVSRTLARLARAAETETSTKEPIAAPAA
ncbi:recombinase family protein [Microbacterium ureisolvens]|uniref:recombinase family protein n=1 Tax=Microbacterium ureisolvens TaxID=2781186 RepID=UPI003634FE42